MCTVDVRPEAQELLGDLLRRLGDALARQYDCDPSEIVVGPVDFGTEEAS
jgi:hypothetical protein